MTTSLARQLKKLAVPQTTILLEDKVKASLLFDPREASSYDRDTIFAIGLTGLEELELIEPEFAIFEQSLFNESAKTFERAVKTQEVNLQLDNAIKKFLVLVSPYFLLRPAHKALEWLIHRFHIHVYNVDDLIACILPYHETRIFVRVIQLLNLNDATSRWHWLKPLQKPGVPLPKVTLLNHCYKDISFMKFICNLVPETLKIHQLKTHPAHRTVTSFYMSSVLGALEYADKVTEEIVATLLPFVLKGLKSGDKDYCAATYMILCQLMRKTHLMSSLCEKLVVKISKHLQPELTMQGFVCLLVIFQYQNLRRFPRLGFLALCSKDVIGSLEHLCHEYHLGPILRPFFQKLVPASLSETAKSVKKRRLLSSLIKTVDLEGKEASFLVRLILQYFMKMYTKDVGRAQKQKHLIKVNLQKPSRSQKWQNPLIKKAGLLLQRLERRYPVCFDQAVGKFIQDVPTKKRVVVQKLLNNFSGSKHKLLPGGSANLYLGLNHPNDNIRMLAVETLACEVSERNKKKSDLDVEFVSENLQSRLADESPVVVAKVLKYRKVLTTYLSDDDITPILMNIVKKQPNNNHRKWCQVRAKALELLFTKSTRPGAGHTKLFIDVLPLIVAVNNHEINLAKSVLQSSLASSHSLLHGIWEEIVSTFEESKAGDTFVDFSQTVLQLLGQNVEQMETSDKETMVESLLGAVDGEDITMKYLVCQLLSCAFVSPFSLNKKVEASYKIVVSFSNWLKEEKIFTEDKMETDEQKELELNLRALRKQKLPLSAILKCLGSIIQGVECGEHLKERSWFVPGSSVTESLLLQLFYLVTELAASCKGAMKQRSQKLLMDFFKYQLGEPEVLGKFMSSLWCFDLLLLHEDVLLKSVVQVRSLYISATLYTASKKHVEHILKNSSTVFPCLLVALTSQLEPVRLAAALCLQKLGEYCGDADNTPYGRLTQHLVNHTEEIIVDSRQLPIVLSKWFAPAVKENDSSTRLRPSTRSAATTHLSTEATTLKILLELVVDTSTPAHIQHGLLRVLQCVNSQDCLGKLLPLLDSMLEPYFNDKDLILKHSQYAIVEQILSKFTSENAELFCKEKSQALQLLKKMLLSSIRVNCGMDSLHLMALKVLTKEFFQALGSPIVQHELLDLVLDLYVNSTSAHDGKAMTKVIKKMCFDGKLLVKVLHQVETSATTKTVRDVKKQRTQTSSPEVENVLDKQPWKKVIVLLEIVQSRSKLQAVETLIPALFDLLKRSLEVGNGPDKHYLQQVILSCLYTCVQQVMSSEDGDNRETSVKLREEHFQVELIVQVIRVSENPQTQNQALLLLNLIACRFSEHVLHNIIAIFTFMGASLVRQDNSYSFQVISQTIETIIPALLETSNQTGTTDETQKTVSMVTRVFVDAVLDVPQHRRLPVFSKLIHTLGPKQYLWIPLGQVFDQHITKQPVQGPAEEKVQGTLPPLVEFAVSLSQCFQPTVQLVSFVKLLEFLLSLPQQEDGSATVNSKTCEILPDIYPLFDVNTHSAKQLRHFMYTTVSFMVTLLSSQTFVSQIAGLSSKSSKKMEPHYQNFLEITLKYIQKVARHLQESGSTATSKFWRVLLYKLYDLLDKINSLLPSGQFICVIAGLLTSEIATVRRKAMEMLNSRLMHHHGYFSVENHQDLLRLVKPLLRIVRQKSSDSPSKSRSEDVEDLVLNRQTALLSLKLLCRFLGSTYPDKFLRTLQVVIKVIKKGMSQKQLTASAILCLAELCHSLRAQAVPFLSDFMSPILELLKDTETLISNELLLLSVTTTLQRLLETLAAFLSSYLPVIINQVCILSANHPESEGQKTPLQQKLKIVCHHLATLLASRVLVPTVEKCYLFLVETKQDKGIGQLMSIFGEHLSVMNKEDLNAHLLDIQNIFVESLNYRSQHYKDPLADVSQVEGHVIACFLKFVLKLSETTFRPVFFKLFMWATQDSESRDKILTFYILSDSLASKLKSLFVLFAGHIVKNTASLLDQNNLVKTESLYFGEKDTDVQKSCMLLQYILSTLEKCFLYDNEGFVTRECFETLMQPLLDQVENLLGTDTDYKDRTTKFLVPCVAQFAVAAKDNSLWKSLNYQLLLKTRHSSARVRFAALQVIREVVIKLAEDYMVLLPEAIPFLAELMEDDSTEVEQQCQSVIAEMEQVLGEPLAKYF